MGIRIAVLDVSVNVSQRVADWSVLDDVYDEEPLPMNSPLRDPELTGSGRLLLSPHLGYVTEQTWRVFYSQTIEAIAAWQTETPIRQLN